MFFRAYGTLVIHKQRKILNILQIIDEFFYAKKSFYNDWVVYTFFFFTKRHRIIIECHFSTLWLFTRVRAIYIIFIIFLGIIPDAILTECAKCSDRQKKQAGKALAHLLTYKPEYWKMLVQKFDPDNVHFRKYMTDDNENDNATPQNQTADTNSNKP